MQRGGKIRRRTVVLYVEDDVINQQVLETMLQSHEDIELLLASDEGEVDEVFAGRKTMPDVVLMDNQLVNTTGLEARLLIC